MLICRSARKVSGGEALREFSAFAQSHLQPNAGASLRIALAESGLRLVEAAARALPADVRSFDAPNERRDIVVQVDSGSAELIKVETR